MRYYLILLAAVLWAGCSLPYERVEDGGCSPDGEKYKVGRGVGIGGTFTEAFTMAKLIAEANAVGINVSYTRIYEDGVFREKVRSRIRGTIHKYEILHKYTGRDGSKRMFLKVWVVPWAERPLFPNL